MSSGICELEHRLRNALETAAMYTALAASIAFAVHYN
jgi:hypothetical protein